MSVYYMWKYIRQQYKNNKLKIIAPMWNDNSELPEDSYSVSGIQDYIKYTLFYVRTSLIGPLACCS